MKTMRLTTKLAVNAFQKLTEDYDVVAPSLQGKAGRFSDTDLVTYTKIHAYSEIEFGRPTLYSAKEYFFPIRDKVLTLDSEGYAQPVELNARETILFLRSCDIQAAEVLDAMFMKNGGNIDPFYAQRRSLIHIFLLDCPNPFESCHCVSMGTSTTENYSVFFKPYEDGFGVMIRDENFEHYFAGGTEIALTPEFSPGDPDPITIPDLECVDETVFGHKTWTEYSRRCIACGRCTVCCPTCSCFTMHDTTQNDVPERTRIWSSCQVKNFGLLAGGHDFRIPHGDRMRYKVMHKIRDFKKRFGRNMCVGCGRCERICPEYISMARCINAIASLSKKDNIHDN